MIKLTLPIDTDKINALKAGDNVLISGVIVTGRDEVHKYLYSNYDKKVAAIIKNTFIYHCGPIVKKVGGKYKVICCGPTTSFREEPYQEKIIRRYKVKGVIGKGGMGKKTLVALRENRAVYLHAPGGAAALLGECVEEVLGVHFLKEFGVPEAMWVIRVKDFPAIVTMDSHGISMHENALKESSKMYNNIINRIV